MSRIRTKTNRELIRVSRKHPKLQVSKIIKEVNNTNFPDEMDPEKGLEMIRLLQDNKDPLSSKVKQNLKEHFGKIILLRKKIQEDKDFASILDFETILKLDNNKKMLKDLQNKDTPLAKYISKQIEEFPEIISNIHDREFLKGLGMKMVAPENDEEKKVSEIMENFHSQKTKLFKNISRKKK